MRRQHGVLLLSSKYRLDFASDEGLEEVASANLGTKLLPAAFQLNPFNSLCEQLRNSRTGSCQQLWEPSGGKI